MAADLYPLSRALSGGGNTYPSVQPGIFRPRGDFWAEVGTMENVTVRGVAKVLEGGAFASGQEAYNEGVGFFLEANQGNPRFSLGDSQGDNMTWDGSQLAISGALTATSGAIGGWTVNATDLSGGNAVLKSAGQLELGTINDIVVMDATDPTYRLWVGNAVGGLSPFRVDKAGQATMTNINVTGGSVAGSVVGSGIQGGNINTGSIAADKISVSTLAAIEANLGTITAGTINATNITVQNLDFGHMQQSGALAADQDFGVNDLTINSSGRLNFGTGGSDHLGNDELFFAVGTGQTAKIRFENPSFSTRFGEVAGSGTSSEFRTFLNATYDANDAAQVTMIAKNGDSEIQALINTNGTPTWLWVLDGGISFNYNVGAMGQFTTSGMTSEGFVRSFGKIFPGNQSSRYIHDANSRLTIVGEVDIASAIRYGQIATTGGTGGFLANGDPVARMAIKDGSGTTWWIPLMSGFANWTP